MRVIYRKGIGPKNERRRTAFITGRTTYHCRKRQFRILSYDDLHFLHITFIYVLFIRCILHLHLHITIFCYYKIIVNIR